MKDISLIGQRLKVVREHLRISQKDFAESIGTVQGHYSNIENGKYRPTLEMSADLYNIYKIDVLELADSNITIQEIIESINNRNNNITVKNADIGETEKELKFAYELIQSLLNE